MNNHASAILSNDELQVVYRMFPPDYLVLTQSLHHFDASMSWFQNMHAYSAWHLKCARIYVSSSGDRLHLANKVISYGIADNTRYSRLEHSCFNALLDGGTKELKEGLAIVLGAYISLRLQDNHFGLGKTEQLNTLINEAVGNGIERDAGIRPAKLTNINECLVGLQKLYDSETYWLPLEEAPLDFLELCSELLKESLIAVETVYEVCERVESFLARERRRL